LTIKQIAGACQLSEKAVRRAIDDGELTAIKLRSRLRVAPHDFDAWVRELRETKPLSLIGKIPPRPVLIVHGAADDVVDIMDARALADAADGKVELRVVAGAGHALRHDPRAIAVLLGWLERQAG
jgi:excisionase family DNA binding protein